MASSSKVWQVLARSNRLYQSLLKTVYARAHASTTKNYNYLTIKRILKEPKPEFKTNFIPNTKLKIKQRTI